MGVSDYSKLSRDAEIEAVSIIRSFVGDQGTVIDTGQTAPYDFEIRYRDDRFAVGEVSVLEDPNYISWWTALLKQENNYSKDLPTGAGTWHASLRMTSRINTFHREIISYIEELENERIYYLDIYDDWPINELGNRGRSLGLSHISKVDSIEGDHLYYGSEGSGGIIPDTVDPLLVEVEALLHNGIFQDSWKKLIPFPADEKHIFFKCGSRISIHLFEYFRPPHTKPLLADFHFPEGITHFWLTSHVHESATLLWISDGQKITVNSPLPPRTPTTKSRGN